MSDTPESLNDPTKETSAVTSSGGVEEVNGSTSNDATTKGKKMGQLTFDDFEGIKHVDTPPDTSAHSMGLRRSKRIPQVKVNKEMQVLEAEEEAAAAERVRKQRAAQKAKARARQREKLAKEKVQTGEVKVENKSSGSAKVTGNPEFYEPPVINDNWTPNMPLLSTDFKTHHSVLSRLKNPNMRPVKFAGDVIKLMSFVNKFHLFFDPELLNLSFQDFEVGLDLYPGSATGTASGIFDSKTQRTLYYQDILPVKNVVAAQDKMNLLFLTLLKLTFSTSKSTEIQSKAQPQATMNQLKTSKKLFPTLVKQLRENARIWGYPREWRDNSLTNEDIATPQSRLFEDDDKGTPVDVKNPEILTTNIYSWSRREPVPFENDPLQNTDLDKRGILALDPDDRMICLRALTDWCGAQSPKIRTETYHLSHFKRDPTFGIQTYHAPRYLVEGADVTYEQFKKLCSVIQSRYEIRSKKKHVKKHLRNGRRPDLAMKLNLLKEIKATLSAAPKEEKDKTLVSLYDKWCKLFNGEILDNPLSDPFEDELYRLRQQEFFVGRVPHIGDFFLPRLQTYPSSPVVSTYLDLRNLQALFEDYANGTIDAYTLFENHGQSMSSQFKLFYRDTPSLLRDTIQGKATNSKNYWYEMCHDCQTLQEFLDFLDFKIVSGEAAQDSDTVQEQGKEIHVEDPAQVHSPVANGQSEVPSSETEKSKENGEKKASETTSTINKHPLPKEARFNAARNKLKCLKGFLSGMLPVLRVFEQLREEYSDMKPGKRVLRRSQRRGMNYDTGAVSEGDEVDDEYLEENDDDDNAMDESVEESDDDEEVEQEPDLKKARVERREARSTRKSSRRA